MNTTVLTNARGGLPPLILACLAATWLIWGSTYLAIKIALTGLPPFLLMASRFLVAGIALLAWTRWRGAPMPSRREWRNAFVVGGLMLGGGMGGTAVAEMTVGSGLVVAFIAVLPLMIAMFNRLYGVRTARGELAGIAVGLAGVLLLTRGAGFAASPAGLVAISVACLSWAAGSVLSQQSLPLAPGATGFASEMICGGAVLLALAACQGESWPAQLSAAAASAWLYLVVFGSLIAFNAYMVLLSQASPALASSYSFVNPVIAMLLGIGLGGEHVSAGEWGAAGIILLGVLLLLRARAQAR
ncbi:drug/metabolite exporter YedA [Aquabacterium sp.]|uniref:drug/metabolite exporter YedA n=1 Tax=Aquabacterium sp. TaxID=1872578 RepID=UPI003784F5CB